MSNLRQQLLVGAIFCGLVYQPRRGSCWGLFIFARGAVPLLARERLDEAGQRLIVSSAVSRGAEIKVRRFFSCSFVMFSCPTLGRVTRRDEGGEASRVEFAQ